MSRARRKKRRVHERDGYACRYCALDLTPDTATVDHVVPASRGGSSAAGNLVTACADCNSAKADRTPAEAGMPLMPLACGCEARPFRERQGELRAGEFGYQRGFEAGE
jgi:5-methylcytosine-specific restriction endonuclease McrA